MLLLISTEKVKQLYVGIGWLADEILDDAGWLFTCDMTNQPASASGNAWGGVGWKACFVQQKVLDSS